MRILAGILLTAALLLGLFGLAESFPGRDERAWKREVQRLSADGRPSEILSHAQTNVRRARESRSATMTVCFPMAALLSYFGWIATTRAETRLPRIQSLSIILLLTAFLFGFYGFVDCFPSAYERALKWEIQRFPTTARASEILFNLRYARENRIQTATACLVIAGLLSSLGWIAISAAETRSIESRRERPIILPAKPHLLFLGRFSAALFSRAERIEKARVGLRPKLETLFDRQVVNEDRKTVG